MSRPLLSVELHSGGEWTEAMLNQNKYCARKPFANALWAVGLTALFGSSAWAGDILFNPTGGASSPDMIIAGIDPAPGNALAVGSIPLTPGSTFQLDFQASVSGLIDPGGLTVTPPGLTSSYQLTTVGSFTEVVTSLSADGVVATFALAPTQGPNSFFELYYNPAVVANNLAGTGFNVGTLILAGTPATTAASIGIFSLSTSGGAPVTTPFDQFLSDHYPGVITVAGSGSALLSADVTYFNPAFFKTPLSQITFNSSLVTPFAQVSPSALFTGLAGGAAPNVTPNIGTINGVNGTDFQLQADANFSFKAVPEPAGIIQASIGLFGVLCFAAWVRR
jgi:hypothetical protein